MNRSDYLKNDFISFYTRNFDFYEVYIKHNKHEASKWLIVVSLAGYFSLGFIVILLILFPPCPFYAYFCLILLMLVSMRTLKCGIDAVNKTIYLPGEKFEQRRNRKFKEFQELKKVSRSEKAVLIDYFEYTIARIKTRPVSSKILMFIIGSFISLFTLAINIYAKDNVEASHSIFVLGTAGIFFLTGMWFTINAFIESFMNRNVARMRNIVEALRYS